MLRTGVLLILLCGIQAADYHVIKMAEAGDHEPERQAALIAHALKLNQACERHQTAKAYFGTVTTETGASWLMYGWRDEVQGLIKSEFPRSLQHIRGLTEGGRRLFEDAEWVPVETVRAALP